MFYFRKTHGAMMPLTKKQAGALLEKYSDFFKAVRDGKDERGRLRYQGEFDPCVDTFNILTAISSSKKYIHPVNGAKVEPEGMLSYIPGTMKSYPGLTRTEQAGINEFLHDFEHLQKNPSNTLSSPIMSTVITPSSVLSAARRESLAASASASERESTPTVLSRGVVVTTHYKQQVHAVVSESLDEKIARWDQMIANVLDNPAPENIQAVRTVLEQASSEYKGKKSNNKALERLELLDSIVAQAGLRP